MYGICTCTVYTVYTVYMYTIYVSASLTAITLHTLRSLVVFRFPHQQFGSHVFLIVDPYLLSSIVLIVDYKHSHHYLQLLGGFSCFYCSERTEQFLLSDERFFFSYIRIYT